VVITRLMFGRFRLVEPMNLRLSSYAVLNVTIRLENIAKLSPFSFLDERD
jgi:hypothetical protein